MCTVERFFIIHPNGFRERGSRLRPCERGTQNIPCNNPIIIERSPEVPGPNLSPPTPPPRQLSPDIHVIEPRQRDRRGRPESTKRPRGFADNLRLLFNTPNLFTSRKKKTSKPKPPRRQFVLVRQGRGRQHPPRRQFVLVRQGRGRQHHPQPEPARYHQPTPPPPPTHNIAPQNRPPVVQVPVHHREPEDMHPRRGQRVPIRDLEYQDEQNSPPPIAPYRQHHRRARTLSPTSRYEERKRAQREAERVEHEQRQRERWRLDQDAERQRRYQAQRDAEHQRRYLAQRDAEQEGRRMQREAERDRRRWDDAPRREAEEIEIRCQERARREAEELASRRRDQARREAAEQERRRQDRARREAAEQERRRQDRARREAEEQERRRQDRARRADQERIERRRAAGIPRGPRHPPAVHQYTRGRGSLDDRGDQVLNEAIQARTEAEQNDPYRGWYRWPDTGGLRRRDTVAGGQRWVTEHDRRRGGRRHWI